MCEDDAGCGHQSASECPTVSRPFAAVKPRVRFVWWNFSIAPKQWWLEQMGKIWWEKKEISSTCPHLLLNTYTLSEHLDSINFFSLTVGNVWRIVVSSCFFYTLPLVLKAVASHPWQVKILTVLWLPNTKLSQYKHTLEKTSNKYWYDPLLIQTQYRKVLGPNLLVVRQQC